MKTWDYSRRYSLHRYWSHNESSPDGERAPDWIAFADTCSIFLHGPQLCLQYFRYFSQVYNEFVIRRRRNIMKGIRRNHKEYIKLKIEALWIKIRKEISQKEYEGIWRINKSKGIDLKEYQKESEGIKEKSEGRMTGAAGKNQYPSDSRSIPSL